MFSDDGFRPSKGGTSFRYLWSRRERISFRADFITRKSSAIPRESSASDSTVISTCQLCPWSRSQFPSYSGSRWAAEKEDRTVRAYRSPFIVPPGGKAGSGIWMSPCRTSFGSPLRPFLRGVPFVPSPPGSPRAAPPQTRLPGDVGQEAPLAVNDRRHRLVEPVLPRPSLLRVAGGKGNRGKDPPGNQYQREPFHGSISQEMSSAGGECVRAPIEIAGEPV